MRTITHGHDHDRDHDRDHNQRTRSPASVFHYDLENFYYKFLRDTSEDYSWEFFLRNITHDHDHDHDHDRDLDLDHDHYHDCDHIQRTRSPAVAVYYSFGNLYTIFLRNFPGELS